jgi:negative regulator of flagellin synthesis FlgM
MSSSPRTPSEQGNVTSLDDARKKRQVKTAEPAAKASPAETPRPAKKRQKGANFNHEKVAAIKAAIANGTYTINPQRIADKFIEQESP